VRLVNHAGRLGLDVAGRFVDLELRYEAPRQIVDRVLTIAAQVDLAHGGVEDVDLCALGVVEQKLVGQVLDHVPVGLRGSVVSAHAQSPWLFS